MQWHIWMTVIYIKDWNSHLDKVDAVLLREARLMTNPTKCMIGKQEACYLGYMVDGGQLLPLMDKVHVLHAFKTHTTKRQVWAFLGLVDCCWFIQHFATIAVLLTNLTKDITQDGSFRCPFAKGSFKISQTLNIPSVVCKAQTLRRNWYCKQMYWR